VNKKPKVTVCIVTYNRENDVLELLDSVYSSNFKDFEVILFDNNSKEKISDKKLSIYDKLKYIYSNKNIGGAGGRNYCEKIANREYLMILDDDTLIDENMIGELVKAMDKDAKIGVAAPKMFFYDKGKTNMLLGGIGKISKLTTLCSDITYFQEDKGQFEKECSIDYAQNGFMVRKSVSDLTEGHDAKLFMTYMETEYFRRIQNLGYKTRYIPTAKLWHKVRLTPKKTSILRDKLGIERPQRIYYNMRNRSVFTKRHFAWYAKIIYMLMFVHLFFIFYLYKFSIYRASRDYFKMLWKGYIAGLLIFIGIKEL